jgi:membrane protein
MRLPGFAKLQPRDVFTEAIKDFFADDMVTYAAAVSYHLMLAFFPFVIFLLTLLGAAGRADFFDQVLDQARIALPVDAADIVTRVIAEIRGQPREGLLSLSLLLALWAASAGMRAVTTALDVAYDVPETRPLWQRLPLSILFTVGLAVLTVAGTSLLLLGPQATGWIAARMRLADTALFWTWLHWPLVVALLLLTFAIIYKVAPNVDLPFRYVTPGSVVGVTTWILASLGFSAYIDRFGNYGATYGSLGGMIVLLLYFFVSAAVLLFGAEINATIHPAREARVGSPSPGESHDLAGICEEPPSSG